MLKPSGKNDGKYCGETIDIEEILSKADQAAAKFGWHKEIYFQTPEFEYRAFRREALHAERPVSNVYISTGIHGDEPAGPMAVMKLLEDDQWQEMNFWILPCLNPTGFTQNTRENGEGCDLNREYREPHCPETQAHIAWLELQPKFDLTLCLHEDWEAKGFYLHEGHKPSSAKKILESVAKILPIDMSKEIDGYRAENGIVGPKEDMEKWPKWFEAFFLMRRGSRQHYTFEASSDFPLDNRIEALMTAVKIALSSLAR